MTAVDWDARVGQSAFNFLRHVTEDASAELLTLLRGQVELEWQGAVESKVRLQPAVFTMVKLALGQDLQEIEAPPEPVAEVAPEPATQEKPRPNFEVPRFYPQTVLELPATFQEDAEEEERQVRAPRPLLYPTLNPTAFQPLQNSNAGWVGTRNVYAKYFNGQKGL